MSTICHRLGKTYYEILDDLGYDITLGKTSTENEVTNTIATILRDEPIRQATFDWLKGDKNWRLRCDAYFSNQQLIIEFDGKQHFEPIEFFGGEKAFKRIQANDAIKNILIPSHGIKLIRIAYDEPYWDKDFLIMRLLESGVSIPNYKLIKDSELSLCL